jgi:hypothetical protein
VNVRQWDALKRVLEAGHPDAATTFRACDGGAEISISGSKSNPGLSGPGDRGTVRLKLGENSPFLPFLMPRHKPKSMPKQSAHVRQGSQRESQDRLC